MNILFDGNMLAWANQSTQGHLKDSKGRSTGAFYGTLRQVRSIIAKFRPEKAYISWDSATNWRKKADPEYKANRESQDQNFYDQIANLTAAFRMLNVCSIEKEGYEADDIAAWCTAYDPSEWLLVTTDRDWFQLIRGMSVGCRTIKIYEPKLKKVIDSANLGDFTDFICAEEIPYIKAFLGDSDNIKAMYGCNAGKVREFMSAYRSDPVGPVDLAMQDFWDTKGKDNFELVDLRFGPKLAPEDLVYPTPGWCPDAFGVMCADYDIKSLTKEDWLAPFSALHQECEA